MGDPINLPPHMRPRYTDAALWDELMNEMAHGKAFTSALRDCAGAPSYPVAKRMLAADPALHARYCAALEDRADSLRDQLLDLADAPIPDNLAGAEKSAWLAPLKSRLHTRRYLASKLFSRQYGARLEVGVMHQISILAALDAANDRAGIASEG